MRRVHCFLNLIRYRKLDDHPITYKTAWLVAGVIANGAKKRRAKK